jgi:hypothetical protein
MQFLILLPVNATLADAIQNLSDARLYAIFGPVILQRSHDYVDEIEEVDYAPGLAQTLIYGSDEYEVEIKHEASTGRLYGDCSCPYDGGACKHIAAFLQYLRGAEDLDEINYAVGAAFNEPEHNAPFDFKAWVKARSREELEELVLQHAPESLRKSLSLQAGSPDVQQELFQKAEKKVKKLLDEIDEYCDYNADDYEEKLLNRLEELRPFWSIKPAKIHQLLCEAIKSIDKAQDQGYLYDHYSDGGFEGYQLGTYLAAFYAALPESFFEESVSGMLTIFGNLNYAICDNFLPELLPKIDHSQSLALKNLFSTNDALLTKQTLEHQKEIWLLLKPLLTTSEQKQLLSKFSDPFFLHELAELYEKEGQPQEAIQLLIKRLPQPVKSKWNDSYNLAYGAEQLYEKLIGLLHQERRTEDVKTWVHRYVEERANARSLTFSLQFLPEAQAELEAVLKKQQINNFAQYLEESFRAPEVVELFKNHPNQFPQFIQFEFFKRNLLLFPKEAYVVFKQVLDQELPIAKDRHYHAVVEVLVLLRELMEKQAFVGLVQSIRTHYKRRTNLLILMNGAGLHFTGQ